MTPRVQLVLPCYNEARRLDPAPFLQFIQTHPEVGLLFVDDGSVDGTPALLERLASASDRVGVLRLERNAGKAAAVQQGLVAAIAKSPELVGYWDADLSTPLGAVDEFIAVLDAHPRIDIVMGARVKLLGRDVRRRALRHYAGRAFATAASVALGVGVYDTQCGAKLFRAAPAVTQALTTPFQSAWVFDVEILSRYLQAVGRSEAEARIREVPLEAWTDVPGSKLRLRHALRAVWDLARLAKR